MKTKRTFELVVSPCPDLGPDGWQMVARDDEREYGRVAVAASREQMSDEIASLVPERFESEFWTLGYRHAYVVLWKLRGAS